MPVVGFLRDMLHCGETRLVRRSFAFRMISGTPTVNGNACLAHWNAAAIIMLSGSAAAAQLAGVALPDAVTLDGAELHLNGIALRTYSWLRIRIYVAGLYLEHPSHDADAILRSPEEKLLVVRFPRR